MTLALVSHIPTPYNPRQLHLWVGVTDKSAAPALSWMLNGTPAVPREIRALAPVLTGKFASAGGKTVYSGFYEFSGLQPDTLHQIELRAESDQIIRAVRTLPATIPPGTQQRLNVLLVSCFHRLEDKTGLAGQVLSQLKVKPHITLFMGDQVYLDLPTVKNFSDTEQWLGQKFQKDYLDNWIGEGTAPSGPASISPGFPQILALGAAAFLPDDHEYWNNYPYASSFIQNTWNDAGRQRWKKGAEMTYQAFQQSGAVNFGDSRVIDLDALSILLLDTRSQRHPTSRKQAGDLLGVAGRKTLQDWKAKIIASASTPTPLYGMLVTGQSLFRSAVGELKGKVADYEFPNYEKDFQLMVGELEQITRAGLPVVCVTGDVHWGRILQAIDPSGANASIFEVISSPTALVSTVGIDQATAVWETVKGLFGSRDPWPRHSDAETPTPRFGTAGQLATEIVQRTSGQKPAAMRGNHATMLRISRVGHGLEVEATCYPLHRDNEINSIEQWTVEFKLRPMR